MESTDGEQKPARRNKPRYIGVRLEEDQYEQFKVYQRARGSTTNHLIEEAIGEAMKRRDFDFSYSPRRITR